MIISTNNICVCYNLYIPFKDYTMLIRSFYHFISAIKRVVIVENDIDYCKFVDIDSHFCKSCYKMVIKKKIPKFRCAN